MDKPTNSIKETISAHDEGEDLPRMGSEREDIRLLKDLRWRIDDIRDMLMSRGFGDERIYGCDEWSTPTVNLQTAINVIDKAIAATDVPVGIASNFPEDSPIIAAFEGIERSVASIAEGVEGYLEDLSEAIDATRVVVQAIRNRSALSAAPQSDGWRPIEDAPKDGRTLLLGHLNKAGKWRTMRGQWMSDEYIAEQWEEPENGEAGWFETSAEADDTPNCWATDPTHFMYLPTAPKMTQTEGQSHG